jgi:hypothetical protein
MTLLDQIRAVSAAYGEARKLKPGRVSTLIFGDGGKLPNIMSGEADLTTARFEKSMQWLSDNWPEYTEWPVDVPRPEPARAS